MIDKEILDAVLPLPTLDELKEQKVEELKDEGFVISNFHSGGVFYTMLMIVLRIKVEVIELLRVVLNNMFVSHAGGAWLDLKMADYSKKRKKAQKTQGFVTVRWADHAHTDLPWRRHIQQRRGLDRAGRQRHRGRREREGANTPLVVGAGAAGDGGHLR